MDKLTIEEKAKAYDEAKLRMSRAFNDNRCSISFMDEIFLELTESEDERIRTAIIKYFKKYQALSLGDYNVQDILAWLEKQGTPQVRTGLEWVNTIDDACDKRYSEEYAHGEYCHEQSFKWGFQEGVDWLEKHGEQKPYGQREECSDCEFRCGDKCIGSCAMKIGEQKPTDKSEPKFKVGDWIVFNGLTLYIKEVVKGYYRTISKGGITNSYDWDIDNVARLWTIQDAKDGDVLSYRNGQWIFIYKEKIDDKSSYYHTLYSTIHQDLIIDDIGFALLDITIVPATKEQRDTLEKAMADAGYTFDFVKKELKKIEQKPDTQHSTEWSVSDFRTWQYIVSDVLTKKDGIGQYLDSGECKKIAKYMQEEWSRKLGKEQTQEELRKGEDYGIDGLYVAMDILNKTLGQVEGYQSDDGILEHKAAITAVKKLYKQKPVEPITGGLTTEFQKQVSYLIASVLKKEHEYTIGYVTWVAQSLLGYAKNELEQKPVELEKEEKSRLMKKCVHRAYQQGYDTGFLMATTELEHKQEWSEEDEKMINSIAVHLNATTGGFPEDRAWADKFMIWLKSLKDRCLPQPKQEWSEEDEGWLDNAIVSCEQCGNTDTADWLKSLRPQKQWKPSEGQLEALKKACNEHWESDGLDPLYTLWEQLKKLREE